MAASTYGSILARNVKAVRNRAGLGQDLIAARMRSLGFSEWRYQTVGNVERGKRRLVAEEMLGLALALETTLQHLLAPSEDDWETLVTLPSGETVSPDYVTSLVYGMSRGAVTWTDDKPEFGPETQRASPYATRFVELMRTASSGRSTTINVMDAGGSAVTFTWQGTTPSEGS